MGNPPIRTKSKMKQVFSNKTVVRAWQTIKPGVVVIALFLTLRYTGALSAISFLTGSALMHTGVMDVSTSEPLVAKKFDYNFKLKDLSEREVDMNDFKGKTIFLNIWATWCRPCRIEMPSIQKLYSDQSDGIIFIMLSVDRREDFDKVKNYIRDKEYTFPVYTPSTDLPEQLQVRSIPTTFVISPDGKIVSHETGAANYDTKEFRKFLKTLSPT